MFYESFQTPNMQTWAFWLHQWSLMYACSYKSIEEHIIIIIITIIIIIIVEVVIVVVVIIVIVIIGVIEY